MLGGSGNSYGVNSLFDHVTQRPKHVENDPCNKGFFSFGWAKMFRPGNDELSQCIAKEPKPEAEQPKQTLGQGKK